MHPRVLRSSVAVIASIRAPRVRWVTYSHAVRLVMSCWCWWLYWPHRLQRRLGQAIRWMEWCDGRGARCQQVSSSIRSSTAGGRDWRQWALDADDNSTDRRIPPTLRLLQCVIDSWISSMDNVEAGLTVPRRHAASVPVGRPSAAAAATVTVPSGPVTAAAAICSLDRRVVRRELLTWAKKLPVVVGTLLCYTQKSRYVCQR